MIKKLEQNVAEELSAQQVITSLPDCIKELIDNSIDAKSTQIRIYLDDYGKRSLSVKDNGIGIENFDFLGKKGSTSKNKENLQKIQTLGFRGQALHSLGRVSEEMKILSKCQGSECVEFNVKTLNKRYLDSSIHNGTTVYIQKLFELLPVRKYELKNKFREYLKKTDELIKQYTLVYPHISFVLINKREDKDQVLIQTSKCQNNWKQRIQQVLGYKIASKLMPVDTKYAKGWILKNIQSGSSRQNAYIKSNMHYLYVNHRPIDPLPRITQLLDSFYRKYNRFTKYIYIIDLKVDQSKIDVNLSPNKRQIYIQTNVVQEIINQLRQFITHNVVQDVPKLQEFQNKFQQMNAISKRKSKQAPVPLPAQEFKIRQSVVEVPKKVHEPLKSKSLIESLNQRMSGKVRSSQKQIKLLNQNIKQTRQILIKQQHISSEQPKEKEQIPRLRKEQTKPILKVQEKKPDLQAKEMKPALQVETDLKIQEIKKETDEDIKNKQYVEQCLNNIPKAVSKQSFKEFKVIGQFNRGFIVCSFQNSFYLIDQHAASEKYHFEKLMNSNKSFMKSNDHISIDPIQADNLELQKYFLRQDGYQYSQLSRNQIVLTKVPIVFNKIFGKSYFLELLEKKMRLKEHRGYYSTAASKACRTAIMIGHVLSKKEMEQIVNELSKLQSPWNCPHGRPTLIDLGTKNVLKKQNKKYKL